MDRAEFDEKVDFLCVAFECSVTGGRRTPSRNASVKGHPASLHLEGRAKDIVPDDPSREVWEYIARAAQRLGIGAKVEKDHIHLQARRVI